MGHALGEIPPFDLHLTMIRLIPGRTDRFFHPFGRRLADKQTMAAADVIDDRLIEGIPGHADRCRIDDSAKREHCDFRCAAADIDHQRSRGLRHRQ